MEHLNRRSRWPWFLAAGVLGVMGAAGALLDVTGSRTPGSARADVPSPGGAGKNTIRALARIEPAGGLIAVGIRPGARIERLHVSEGDVVKAGQPLAVLEGHKAAELQVAQAEGQKQSADVKRGWKKRELEVSRKRETRVQKARLESLKNVYTILEGRWSKLSKTQQDFEKLPQAQPKDKADLAIAVDRLQVEAHRAYVELEQAKADDEALPARQKIEDEQVAAEGPEEDVLQRQIDLARAQLDLATVAAPAAGQVVEILAHAGEVSSGPILTLADLSSIVAVAEVYETEIPGVAIDAPAEVTILGKKVTGKVTMISRTVGKNVLQNLDPRMPQDLRVVRVTIALDSAEPASQYLNMQVDASIRPSAATAP